MANTPPTSIAAPATTGGLVAIPAALYVVAALFFAKGLFFLITTIVEAFNTRAIDIVGLLPAGVLMLIGLGLAYFAERSRNGALFVLICGVLFRCLVVVTLAFFLLDYFAGRTSDQSRSALQGKSGGYLRLSFGSVKIVKVSASPKTGWYLVRDGTERILQPADLLGVAAFYLLGIGLNLWQRRVLRNPDTLRVFEDINRANLSGQMSLVRFLLLTTVFLSIHLAIWKVGSGFII